MSDGVAPILSISVRSGRSLAKHPPKIERAKGRKTQGYFYRRGRGWYSKDGSRFVPVRFEDGAHLKAEDAGKRDVGHTYARFLISHDVTSWLNAHSAWFPGRRRSQI